jgi:hypothetical protein
VKYEETQERKRKLSNTLSILEDGRHRNLSTIGAECQPKEKNFNSLILLWELVHYQLASFISFNTSSHTMMDLFLCCYRYKQWRSRWKKRKKRWFNFFFNENNNKTKENNEKYTKWDEELLVYFFKENKNYLRLDGGRKKFCFFLLKRRKSRKCLLKSRKNSWNSSSTKKN